MGGALMKQWSTGDENFTVVDPGLDEAPEGAELFTSRDDVADRRFDVVVVAIKPQQIDTIVPDYTDAFASDGYVLSIAAGASIDRLKQASGGRPVVRVMPNLPAAIGKGVSGICASDDATADQLGHARDMMERAGLVVTVDSEDDLDRVTAVAGSGPAYVFETARTYVAAAMELGFDQDQARAMVLGTIEGATAMAKDSDASLEDLRLSVTSKGGTTAAGLEALNGDGMLTRRLQDTLDAAYRRAVELR